MTLRGASDMWLYSADELRVQVDTIRRNEKIMNLRKSMLTGILASTLSLSGGAAVAQEGTPVETPAASPPISPATITAVERFPLSTPDGVVVAYVDITQNTTAGDVTFIIESTDESTLEPGKHGIHVHEVGACDASGDTPYESAGGHYNPTNESHGGLDDEDSHAGDLGNIEVDEDGAFSHEITTDKVTLIPTEENTLNDEDGSALIIHAGEDDLETDPSGESGDRIACGVIFPSVEPALNGTPPSAASPVATPEN